MRGRSRCCPGTVAIVVPALLLGRETPARTSTLWRALLGAPLVARRLRDVGLDRAAVRADRQGDARAVGPDRAAGRRGPVRPRAQPDDHRRARGPARRGARLRLDRDRDLGRPIFAVVNHVFFLAYEEPAVERRFGDEYRRYKAERPALDPAPHAVAPLSAKAPVAQWTERLPSKQRVAGSNPARGIDMLLRSTRSRGGTSPSRSRATSTWARPAFRAAVEGSRGLAARRHRPARRGLHGLVGPAGARATQNRAAKRIEVVLVSPAWRC